MFCDEPYTPGHQLKHKKTQIFVMEGNEDEFSDGGELVETVEGALVVLDKPPTISINALSGSTTFNCMRVIGQYGKKKLYILIDSGSTHNFLDLTIAKELGCELEKIKPMRVAAANGNNMISGY